MPDVHNRTRYLAGCRCDQCKLANSEYRKELRQRKKGAEQSGRKLASVRSMPANAGGEQSAPRAPVIGDVQQGVIAEIDTLGVAASRPGLVQTAYALARVLDNQLAIAQHPSAARQLSELMDKLRKSGSVGKGKLAAVRAMTRQTGTGEATG
ncbi:Uncharacterised protein [Mycobacteroides abscessus subsp. abscessus]|uniref:hypothetical protein n=1 Tax=Mycobacteroides abscessus TaxID=36809 RepID=UPI0005E63701|nr:hypothetical protein [Mycobacteroides abscessus]CPW40767.1 Uncharacterised protein [Mycobacteroides abscessus]SID55892.1 Uncharacterised protein [Mycobacteroides abscessus subsp. abscessus]SKE67938.1 Uncharacterised protein [Mycobacteroides abscessus subsp. abscessus]SKF60112.1 Uncharacterised protein [Mycobacteroides abscessus subsp. bolletii]SKH50900.1 Uncharacterised protein [Mycobacteroides abscessus subsp. bolletii]